MSDNLKMRGVVKTARQNNYGFGSIKIGDTWYSTGKKAAPSVSEGNVVEFEYYLKDGKYANIKGDVRVVEQSSTASSGGGQERPAQKDGYWDGRATYEQKVRDPRIARTEALKLAVSAAGTAASLGGLEFIKKAKEQDRLAAIREVIFQEARAYLNFANGVEETLPTEEQAQQPPTEDQQWKE